MGNRLTDGKAFIRSLDVDEDINTVDVNVERAITSVDSIQFDQTAAATAGEAELTWNDTDGTLDLGMKGGQVTQQIGMEQYVQAKHVTNAGITEGKVMYVAGSDGANKLVGEATASAAAAQETIGIATETVTGGNKALITTFGLVRNIDTDNLTEGQPVWLSASVAGKMEPVKPAPPNYGVLIGYCVRKNKNNGVVFVRVQPGSVLGGTDSNVKITNPQDGDVLTYSASAGIWVNRQP